MGKEKSPLDEPLDNLLEKKSPRKILGQDGLLDELTKLRPRDVHAGDPS
jgi:hypothetical protein